jgi:hypothetical protein
MMVDDYPVRFAGEGPEYPNQGDYARVLAGEFAGEMVEVIGVSGHAFKAVYRVIVRNPRGETVWYWPWNLAVVGV